MRCTFVTWVYGMCCINICQLYLHLSAIWHVLHLHLSAVFTFVSYMACAAFTFVSCINICQLYGMCCIQICQLYGTCYAAFSHLLNHPCRLCWSLTNYTSSWEFVQCIQALSSLQGDKWLPGLLSRMDSAIHAPPHNRSHYAAAWDHIKIVLLQDVPDASARAVRQVWAAPGLMQWFHSAGAC